MLAPEGRVKRIFYYLLKPRTGGFGCKSETARQPRKHLTPTFCATKLNVISPKDQYQ
jgi:hypothetical protein